MKSYHVPDAISDGLTLNTACLQKAIDACAAQGGGRVVLAPGTYLSGALRLRDRVILHLEEGAVLKASGNLEDYPLKDHAPAGFIFAENGVDTGITGPGCLDGNGEAFWKKLDEPHGWAEDKKRHGTWVPHFDYEPMKRPRAMILFSQCRNVLVEDVIIRNSMHWTLVFFACLGGIIRGITMRNPLHGPNTDGIDLDACSDFLVENCDILTGDDAIALKNRNTWGLKRPSRNITVKNCRLRSATHGFTIGTETQDDFENIQFTDSSIEKAGDHRTLTGIGLSILDGASIRGDRVSNIRVEDAVAAIQIRLGNEGRGQLQKKPGTIEDIEIKDIVIRGATGVCLITGLPGHPLQRIKLEEIDAQFEGGLEEAKILPEVPELESEYPLNEVWRGLPAYGFFCRHVEGLKLSRITLSSLTAESRPGLLIGDCQPLRMESISDNGKNRNDAVGPADDINVR